MNRRERINEILTDLECLRITRFAAIEHLERLFKKKEAPPLDDKKILQHMEIRRAFEEHIHTLRGLSSAAVHNMELRLKTFSVSECVQAILNFSRDSWNMENNGHRSIEWFFHSDSRIETFLNLKPKTAVGEGTMIGDKVYKSEKELIDAEQRGEIYYDTGKNKFFPTRKN